MRHSLLAVDLGLRTGLALFGDDGRLRWCRSQNFGSVTRLKRGIHGVLSEVPALAWLVAEGDRHLFELWEREAARRGAGARRVGPETWRPRMLLAREQRSGAQAKQSADAAARRIIEWSGAPRPPSLRHDAAEAVLIGFWGVLEVGWLDAVPPELRGALPPAPTRDPTPREAAG
ncbi:MAG TPA: hypothetical protein VGV85_07700 [Longimicrobiaceae bacterium]|nr:hypothetical protein [Longimicrobiaceae bacterium]